MNLTPVQHSWNLGYHQAVALQHKLKEMVKISPLPIETITYMAAADVSFNLRENIAFAAVLVFTFPQLERIEVQQTVEELTFPYIPGLLSFREAPVLVPLFLNLNTKPDVVLVDGQGIAHPRKFGLAAHLGVLLNMPTIGCAKKRLFGEIQTVPEIKGECTPLISDGEEIGRVLCTRSSVKPLFISIGHRVDLDSAVQIVMSSVARYRIPAPLRLAHRFVNEMRKNGSIRERKDT